MTDLSVVLTGVAGWLSGFLLLRKIPTLSLPGFAQPAITVIIPARNEAANLPRLLASLQDVSGVELIVVDDDSSDATATVARQHGAQVLSSQSLPAGWYGKPWACWQGAQAARHNVLLFLDADTRFVDNGFQLLCNQYLALPGEGVVSILPYHRMEKWFEQLSLFFNLLMAAGAGGFAALDKPQIFGQSMMISRTLYFDVGGHASVRNAILENMALAEHVRGGGGAIANYVGKRALEMRMFPEGFAQMHASWKKGCSQGARNSSVHVFALSLLYISGCIHAVICVFTVSGRALLAAIAIYLAYAGLLLFQTRQLGQYRVMTALLYPIPLLFYLSVLAESITGTWLGRKVSWRGREV